MAIQIDKLSNSTYKYNSSVAVNTLLRTYILRPYFVTNLQSILGNQITLPAVLLLRLVHSLAD